MLWLFVGMEPIIPFIRLNAKSQNEYTGPWSLMHSIMWAAKCILGVNIYMIPLKTFLQYLEIGNAWGL